MVKHNIVTKDHNRHEDGLGDFYNLFQKVRMKMKVGVNIVKVHDKVMEEDGYFEDLRGNKKITFDWEQFTGYYSLGERQREEVYQLERKVTKHKIDAFIQCSMDRKAITFGYHKDVDMNAEPITIKMKTPHYVEGFQWMDLYPLKRYIEFSWEQMEEFILFLRSEFDKQ